MNIYVALRSCIYNGDYYKAGQYLQESTPPMACPECTGGTPEGGVCRLCKDSKRISPPHHFKLLGGTSDAKEKEIPESHKEVRAGEEKEALLKEAERNEILSLRAEIKNLGGSYHGFDGVERLKMTLQKLRKEVGERNVAPQPVVYE